MSAGGGEGGTGIPHWGAPVTLRPSRMHASPGRRLILTWKMKMGP